MRSDRVASLKHRATVGHAALATRFIGAGANFLWQMRDGVCGTELRIHGVDLTVRVEVVDKVPSDPSRTTSGASEVPIRVTCMPSAQISGVPFDAYIRTSPVLSKLYSTKISPFG